MTPLALAAADQPAPAPAPAPDEAQLIGAARRGDAAAFESLYRRFGPSVYGLCLRMTGRVDQAEDCTQDTFVSAWRALPNFAQRSGFGTWLHRIAVNAVLDDRRTRTRIGRLIIDTEAARQLAVADRSLDPGGTVDVERAIARLPQGARHVLVIVGIYGYSHADAAQWLGISEGTCKSQLHRARQLLTAHLALPEEHQ